MSYIVSLFRFIILPFHYLWVSSLLSIQTMTKGYNISNKSGTSLSMNVVEQEIFSKTEIQNVIEPIKSIDDKFRQRSQRFLTKLRKITIQSISSNPEEENKSQEKQNKSSIMSTMTSTPPMDGGSILESRVDLGSTSKEEPKLQVCLIK